MTCFNHEIMSIKLRIWHQCPLYIKLEKQMSGFTLVSGQIEVLEKVLGSTANRRGYGFFRMLRNRTIWSLPTNPQTLIPHGFFFNHRHTHSQILWEELLGRKLEAAAAKKLEEAFLEYRVRKSVPSWLPFLPNGSFWIPSSEETIKSLQVLAEKIRVSKSSRKSSSASLSLDGSKISSISKVAEWSLIQQTDKLLSQWGGSKDDNASASSDTIATRPPSSETQLKGM